MTGLRQKGMSADYQLVQMFMYGQDSDLLFQLIIIMRQAYQEDFKKMYICVSQICVKIMSS